MAINREDIKLFGLLRLTDEGDDASKKCIKSYIVPAVDTRWELC
ncbi:hypothetical protein [Sansalvadorimonas verongulae]|nr:hypothetical protein [Sansalvadorimonas verongulae]